MISVAIAYGFITPYFDGADQRDRTGDRVVELENALRVWPGAPATHLTLAILPTHQSGALAAHCHEEDRRPRRWRVTSTEQENTLASARSERLKGKPGPVGPDASIRGANLFQSIRGSTFRFRNHQQKRTFH
ncbi:hypothetical protein [Thiocapsa sp.]|uniref:hypothetical protein n=1 Tax=Thiocapsa sp. TaxID=2024551 RepID=UPI00359367BD